MMAGAVDVPGYVTPDVDSMPSEASPQTDKACQLGEVKGPD
jgi:hypothetical protein